MSTPVDLKVYRIPRGKGFGALTWYRKWAPTQHPAGPPATVPCGGCTACCRSYEEIYIEPTDAIPPADTEQTAAGDTVLRRQADGACVYLVNEQCQIYDRRPHACRSYDCRAQLVLGFTHSNEHAVIAAATEKFGMPLAKEPDDATFLLAIRLMVAKAVSREVSPLLALQLGKWREFLPLVNNPEFRQALEEAAKDPEIQRRTQELLDRSESTESPLIRPRISSSPVETVGKSLRGTSER